MILSVDTETTGVLWQDKAFCATTYSKEHGARFYTSNGVDPFTLKAQIYKASIIVCHNLKFDYQKLEPFFGYRDYEFHDTMIMAHLLDEHQKKGLKDLVRNHLGIETDEEKELAAVRRKLGLTKDDGYDKIPLEVLKPYALKDAEYTYRLYELFWPQIVERGLEQLYRMEIKRSFALGRIEGHGLKVDKQYVQNKVKEYGSKIYQAKKRIENITQLKVFDESDLEPRLLPEPTYTKTGKISRTHETKKQAHERVLATTFNPNSPSQLLDIFKARGIMLESTGVDELKKLDDPLAESILELREAMKIRQTYLLGILKEEHEGILHPHFRITGTVSGRLSSGLGE